jgi:hypothetical protein
MSKALGLLPGVVPTDLDERGVVPVVDAFQQGAGVLSWTISATTIPAGTAAATGLIVVASSLDHERLVRFAFNRTGGAGNIAVNFYLQLNPATTGAIRVWQNEALPTPFNFNWFGEMNGVQYLHIPPGFDLKLAHPGTAAGESFLLRFQIGTCPAGFKVW